MRRALINVFLISVVCGSLYDIVMDQEHWPFSQYPMFSGLWKSPSFTWLRLFGVTADGREFPLDANRYIEPFDQSRLPKALKRMTDLPDGEARLRLALPDLMARYEELRSAGVHDGPPLMMLRLYELEWTIDRQAANVDHPDRRRLIAEVVQ
jgi:hypothetical protein